MSEQPSPRQNSTEEKSHWPNWQIRILLALQALDIFLDHFTDT